ncbi:MAG: four helix bundle protein [Microgenomates group bacterium]|jgi:four helix bundle protein
MRIQRFQDLQIWQSSIKIVKEIYAITNYGKFSHDFGFRDQIRRAAVSISSNIVEGFEKNSNNEFIRFLKIAKGSTGEVKNQVIVAFEIGYLTKKEHDDIYTQLELLAKQTASLISYLEKNRQLSNQISKKQTF